MRIIHRNSSCGISRPALHATLRPTLRHSRGLVALVLLATLAVFTTQPVRAQSGFITHSITKLHESPPTMGREFWFGVPSNYWGVNTGGKYLHLFITSPYNTTAYAALGTGIAQSVAVTAYKIATINLPFSDEIENSGSVEQAVHVWSNDADLTVYFMSHDEYTSDGTYVVPTIGWGTDYVVAGYASLFEPSADYPSEFTIAANTDNTVIQITPACDLRQGGESVSTVGYAAGHTFQITLNRGESEQFLSVLATNADNYDVTGTIVHSNNPVGVIGGSMCTNIPLDFPYCDHVEHMMPPVRTWASTYYSTYFTQPTGQNGHDYGLYLFVSSKPGQTIWKYNSAQGGTSQECVIGSKYGTYWDEIELAQKFWSDAPFMLVEYINSSSYPDHVNGDGDPAEVVINPREQFTKTVVFESPIPGNGQQAYDNYATITINKNDEATTTIDGNSILTLNSTKQNIDDTFEIFTYKHLPSGVHIIAGDTAGAGVYIYGYGFDESYAWVGSFGTGTFHATDTIPPEADTFSACYDAFIHLSDTGALATKLAKIQIDSDYNMTFTLDSDWLEGVGLDTSGYGISVTDPTKEGYLQVTVYDIAGNATSIVSRYQPNYATIVPAVQDFGTVALGVTAVLYDTIRNTGKTPFDIKTLTLKLGNQGFSLVNPDLSPIPADSSRVVEIQFTPKKGQEAYDTLDFGSECLAMAPVAEGNAGAADYSVDNQTWLNVPLTKDTGWVQKPVVIHNKTSLEDLVVKFDSVSDPTHFYLAPYQAKTVTVPKKKTVNGPDGLDSVWFIYQPTVVEQDKAQGYWESAGENANGSLDFHNDSLFGNPIVAQVTFAQNIDDTIDCPQAGDTLRLTFVLSNSGSADAIVNRVTASNTLDFSKPIGILANDSTWDPAKVAQTLAKSGGADTIVVTYGVPTGGNASAWDTITAYGSDNQPMGKVIAHIQVNELTMTFNPPTLDFGQVPYQSGKVTKTFTITNPNATPVIYNDISFAPVNGSSPGSYSVSPSAGNGLPVTLTQGQSLTVSVTFDPSVSFVDSQWVNLEFASTACDTSIYALSISGLPPDVAQSTVSSPILACSHTMDTITITNPSPEADTIHSANWLGADSTAFLFPTNPEGLIIPSDSFLRIPVEFIPNAQDSNLHTDIDSIAFALKNSKSISTVVATVQGTSNFVDVEVTSQFPPPSGNAGTTADLPMSLTVNPRNLTVNDTDLDITGVRLVYLISNPDLLNITKGDLTNAVAGLPPGWSVAPGSYVTKLGDSVVLVLRGPKLPNGTITLGQIGFTVTLPKLDTATNVTLAELTFFSDSATAGCINPMVADSNFSLIQRCGDPTLRGFMQGGGIVAFIQPAKPDPVTGGEITFQYANWAPARLTLTIYDVLGREVARPVGNVYHEAGSWEASADVAKLPAGTYTYRLSAEGNLGRSVISKQFVIDR